MFVLFASFCVVVVAAAAAASYPVSRARTSFVNRGSPTAIRAAIISSTVRKVNNHQARITLMLATIRASHPTALVWESVGYVDGAGASRIGALRLRRIRVREGRSHSTFHIVLSAHDSPHFHETLCAVNIVLLDAQSHYRVASLANNRLDPHNSRC